MAVMRQVSRGHAMCSTPPPSIRPRTISGGLPSGQEPGGKEDCDGQQEDSEGLRRTDISNPLRPRAHGANTARLPNFHHWQRTAHQLLP